MVVSAVCPYFLTLDSWQELTALCFGGKHVCKWVHFAEMAKAKNMVCLSVS